MNCELLVVARESRGLTQLEVADRAGLSQSLLSKYENGIDQPSKQHVSQIAQAIGYEPTLFYEHELFVRLGSCLYHRKQASMTQRDLKRVHATVSLGSLHVAKMLRGVSIEPTISFPQFDIGDFSSDAELIAGMVRTHWQLPRGPIRSLVREIERAGGIVMPMEFGTRKISAVCHPSAPPIFCVNSQMPTDRIRYTLAHELGHIVMHHLPTQDMEKEADRFAAEFLMPKLDVLPDLSEMSLPRAAQLKPYWRVSMGFLIIRARDLGQISQGRYERLWTEMGARGYRLNEPAQIEPEKPSLLPSVIEKHYSELGFTTPAMASMCHLTESEFRSKYLTDHHRLRLAH